jgi:diacylglycerol O-acyltransferase
MCSGALRGYLGDAHALPKASLKAMVPISLRRPGDLESANAVGAISADLATHLRDPIRRFRAIQASMQAGKKMLEELSATEAQLVMQLLQFPGLLLGGLGLISRFPPYSTVISNVPGPRDQLYWNGARLEGIYPASIVFDGFALNITLVTYAEQVDFGITACRRSLPQVQRLIDHLEHALTELEEAAGLVKSPARRTTKKKSAEKKGTKKKAAKKSTRKAKKTAKKKAKKKAKTAIRKRAAARSSIEPR